MYLLQVAVASDAYRVRRPVPPPDAPAVRRLSHARRSHWTIADRRKLAANKYNNAMRNIRQKVD